MLCLLSNPIDFIKRNMFEFNKYHIKCNTVKIGYNYKYLGISYIFDELYLNYIQFLKKTLIVLFLNTFLNVT